MKKFFLICAILGAVFAKDYEVIDSVNTSFRIFGKNDRIEVISVSDPKIDGVTCFISYAKKGGAKEIVGVEEDRSEASVSCSQTAPKIIIKEELKKEDIFAKKSSLIFKKTHVVRMFDEASQSIIYLVYSDKIIDGSPDNSISAIPCNQAVGKVCEFNYKK
ncbi:CreA family protein [Campylobacter sp. JMF_02 ED1]|uniref:CreA family protein n=1 Tax=unclassified Campylobacter TaxID=2593542 RepID=UPI0022E9F8BB|nr:MULTISPECIES: CreA family protein [unclassified Campylobacter]MDA3048753.1 CreA family protein [Campylobacter sp. JMF_15 NE4]MDA3050535.1 CreA family protein [Campylobacter sp. JMF_02 ED1]MDA3075978.1 CreA family protein [Campylobacter sp. JMF_04 NA10]